MAMTTIFSGMGSACMIKFASHTATVHRANRPLEADNFRATFWFDNGIRGPRVVEGFRTFAEAQRFAQSVLPDGFLPTAKETA
jgi:hypothetical protein